MESYGWPFDKINHPAIIRVEFDAFALGGGGGGGGRIVLNASTFTVGSFDLGLVGNVSGGFGGSGGKGGQLAMTAGQTIVPTGQSLTANNGIFSLASNLQFSTNSYSVTGGSLTLTNTPQALNGLSVSAGSAVINGGSVLTMNFGSVTSSGGGTIVYDNATVNGGFISGSGHSVQASGATFSGSTFQSSAVVSQTAAASFNNVTSNGTINNNASLTWNGGSVGSPGKLNANSTTTTSNFFSDGVINIAGGGSPGTIVNSGTSLVLGGGSRTYVGTVATPGGSIDLGGQTLELNGGLLWNVGTVMNGTTNVNFGGVVHGSGSFSDLAINFGGTQLPGNSPGIQSVTGSLTWNNGGNLNWQIYDAAGDAGVPDGWDFIDVDGTFTINAGYNFNLSSLSGIAPDANGNAINFDPTQDYSWLVAHADGGITGDPNANLLLHVGAFNGTGGFTNSLGGGAFSFQITGGTDLFLVFTAPAPVPEPGSLALLGLAAAGGTLAAWRRKRAT